MSRGYGRVERIVITTLRDDPDKWWSMTELASVVSTSPGSHYLYDKYAVDATARAIKSLGDLVTAWPGGFGGTHAGWHRWYGGTTKAPGQS